MQLIIDLTSHNSPAPGRMFFLPLRKVLACAAGALAAGAAAAGAGAYFLAAYWVESGADIARDLQEAHAARQQVAQTQEWQAHLDALHGELAALNARVVELYGKGAVLSGHVGLPARMFALNDNGAPNNGSAVQGEEALLCNAAADENAKSTDSAEFSAEETHALFADFLRRQAAAVSALELKYESLKEQRIHHHMLMSTLPMERPVLGWHWVSSRYGYRKDPFTGRRAFHAGYDYAGRKGTPIVAGARGLVTYAGRLGRYGNTVKINHGGGISTLYGHMHKIHVVPGQHVRQGEVIGTIGSTGRSTGPHLHYEVRVNNRPRAIRRTLKKLHEERALQQPAT